MTEGAGIIVSDYDSSLIFNELINNVKLSANKQILQCLKSNPFYQKIDEKWLTIFLNKINHIDFEKIISDIPNELIDHQHTRPHIQWNVTGNFETTRQKSNR